MFLRSAGSFGSTTTDASGEYSFTGLPAGSVWLAASSDGTALRYWSSGGAVASAGDATPVAVFPETDVTKDFELSAPSGAGGSVGGTASASPGGPVYVGLMSYLSYEYGWLDTRTVQSGFSFNFPNVPAGTYVLCGSVNNSMWPTCSEPFVVDGSAVSKNVTMNRLASLRGFVLDADGAPLANGRVNLCLQGQPDTCLWDDNLGAVVRNGAYDMAQSSVSAGTYLVYAHSFASGDGSGEFLGNTVSSDDAQPVTLEPGRNELPVIRLDRRSPGSLSGRVMDKSGNPMPNATVVARSAGRGSTSAGYATTNASGDYLLSGLSDVPHSLTFGVYPTTSPVTPSSESYRFDPYLTATPTLVRPTPGGTTSGLDVHLNPKTTVSGIARDKDDNALAGGQVCLLPDNFWSFLCVETADDGTWTTKVDPGYTYRAYATPTNAEIGRAHV